MEFWIVMKICEAHLPCICCKVKSQTAPERSVILLDQNSTSVWNFWWNYTPLLDMISFSSFCFETWLAFSHEPSCVHHFFLFFWDLHVSLFFFNLFAQPCCLFLKTCQRDLVLEHEVFILVVMENMFQCISSVGIVVYLWHVREL